MTDPVARGEVRRVEIEAKVIRCDGSVEDLGTISRWDRDEDGPMNAGPVARLVHRCRRKLSTRHGRG